MVKLKIENGERYGRLVVLGLSHGGPNGRFYNCVCDCGKHAVVRGTRLKSGGTKSCGCFRVDVTTKKSTKHGFSPSDKPTGEYQSWANMLQRCTNKNNPAFMYYGGRGIAVCDKWLSFAGFIEDMGPRPSDKHTIERIDTNGPYSKDNCKWLPRSEQANNRRNCVLMSYRGETRTMKSWAIHLGISYQMLRHRIVDLKWDAEKAINAPKKPGMPKKQP